MSITRKDFINRSAGIGLIAAGLTPFLKGCMPGEKLPKLELPEGDLSKPLPEMPYTIKALDPHISHRTLAYHYRKHHYGYVKKVNGFIKGTQFEKMSLEEIIRKTYGDRKNVSIYNNAAQVWNHTFYWNSMKPGGGGKPTGNIAEMIDKSFGGYAGFKEAFLNEAGVFGSGWVWLVQDGDRLEVVSTENAHNPLTINKKPLLTMDVWEHAYYLDYMNERGRYAEVFIDYLLNWEFANKNLG